MAALSEHDKKAILGVNYQPPTSKDTAAKNKPSWIRRLLQKAGTKG
jgi:hypothetical protein